MAKTLSYSEQLLHPNWQKRRLEILSLASFECQNCGDTEKTLHVHHRRYIKGRKAWEYADEELSCLCEECHGKEHAAREELDAIMLELDIAKTPGVVALVRGYARGELKEEPYDCHHVELACGQVAWWLDHFPMVASKRLLKLITDFPPDHEFWREV